MSWPALQQRESLVSKSLAESASLPEELQSTNSLQPSSVNDSITSRSRGQISEQSQSTEDSDILSALSGE